MKVVAVYHIKGGVGKTATAVNMAWCAAHAGNRTLLCDLDPQASSSFYFRVKAKLKGGVKPLISGQLGKHIKATDYERLDILPADFSFRNLDLALNALKDPRQRLRASLQTMRGEYDMIYLDCPANLTLLAECLMFASDVLLCPVIPTPLSERTLQRLRGFIHKEDPAIELWPFFSMVEGRKKLHQEVMLRLPESHGPFLPVSIPYLADIERMGVYRQPVSATSPGSASSKAYAALYKALCAVFR